MEAPKFELQPQNFMENTKYSDEEVIIYGLRIARERQNMPSKGFRPLIIGLDYDSLNLASHHAREYGLTKQDLKQVNIHFVTNEYAETLKDKAIKRYNQKKARIQSLHYSDDTEANDENKGKL